MSRCYPYPPPGYEKKAAQPPEIMPSTKKEKHKHKDKDREKDKEKKKKRKRDDNAKDESSHKDKRSSKHQKAAAAGNDVGVHPANGRVQQQQQQEAEPAFVAADRLLDCTQEPAQGLFQVDKTHHGQDIGEQQSREASVLDRTGTGTGREAADKAGHSGSSATSTSYGRAPESSRVQPPVKKDRDKEVNGKLPTFKPLLDTGQPRQQQQQQQQRKPQQQQQQQKSQQQPQQQKPQKQPGPHVKSTEGAVKPIVRTAEAVANAGPVQPSVTDVVEKAEKADKADKVDKAEKRAEEEKKRSEKEEKRSKLLELPPVNNLDEDDKLEWLFPNKRKEAAAGNGDAGAGVVVWAEPAFMSSADIYALPYVVPY